MKRALIVLLFCSFCFGDIVWRAEDSKLENVRSLLLENPGKVVSTGDTLEIVVSASQTQPSEAGFVVFSQDYEYLWRQVYLPVEEVDRREGDYVLRVPVAGVAAETFWECHGHSRPWNILTSKTLRQFGVRLENGVGSITVKNTAVLRRDDTSQKVYDVGLSEARPKVGESTELSFRLARWMDENPFDPESLKVEAVITLPTGKTEVVRGFYYEDFQYDRGNPSKSGCLTPAGAPSFRVRYSPQVAGVYSMAVTVTAGKKKAMSLPVVSFTAEAGAVPYRGIVRVDAAHPRYLAYEDGTEFKGIGINIRSPFDNRYFGIAPYSTWRDYGLDAYERLFKKCQDCGISVVEVWMSSWWLALEWINNDVGFRGVGHYNQYRGWMLDYILRLAEKHGISLILVINNHGKFGMTFDSEWAYNPYNKKNGGYLEKCQDFFWEPRAKADFKKLLDYIVARWGWSKNILCWKLFTEVDLTGVNMEWYKKDPNIAKWHSEMGAYLHEIDVRRHPVTTHWMLGYYRIDEPTARVKELDFLTTDAYYQGGGVRELLSLLKGTRNYAGSHGKPLILTEFGGSSYGDSMRNLANQVELGLWAGYFLEHGIPPMNWWFALVDDRDLYSVYKTLWTFGEDVSRRDMKECSVTMTEKSISHYGLSSETMLIVYAYDTEYYYTSNESKVPAEREGVAMMVSGLADGTYSVLCVCPVTGEVLGKKSVEITGGKGTIELPGFSRSIAVKVKKK